MLGSDYITQVRNLIHDPNASDFSDTTLLGFINQARTRVALDTQCVQTYIAGLNTIANQEQYPINGFVGGATVTAGGTGYGSGSTVTVSGGSGTGAAASPVIVGGVVTGINMTNWGTGYAFGDTVSITVNAIGGGSGATATAILGTNIINWLQPVDVNWGNLKISFDYLPFGTFNAFARAYTAQTGRPGCFTVHLGNQKAFLFNIPDQVYPMAINASVVTQDLATTASSDTQINAPWNDAVKYYACFLAHISLQRHDLAAVFYTGNPNPAKWGIYDSRIRQLPASVTPYRIFNPYMLGRKRIRRM